MKLSQLETATVRWNYVDQGAGIPLLLVHGFPLDHSMWRFQIEDLSQHARVIVPDLPGFGKSKLKVERETRMEVLADELREFVEGLNLGTAICFCGLSMGGYIGWQYWKRHGNTLAALIACDTKAAADTAEVARGRELAAIGIEREGSGFIADGLIQKLFAPSTIETQAEIVEQTREVICRSAGKVVAAAHRGMAVRADATDWLGQISIPTLAIVGEHDVISTRDEMEQMAKAMSGELVCLEQAGHMPPLETPKPFNAAVIDFLKQLA